MAQVWECEFKSLSHQLVLLALADYADDTGGHVYPSLARLAWKIGCSERHIQSAMTHFRKQGILVKVADPGYRRPTEYRIDMSKATKKQSFDNERVNITSPIDERRVKPSSQKGEQEFSTRVNRSSQEPSLNHQEPSYDKTTFGALAEVCHIDLQTITQKLRGMLNQTDKILRKAGTTPKHIEAFGDWWYKSDWRGKRGEAPRPEQVRDEWGKFKAYQQKQESAIKWQDNQT